MTIVASILTAAKAAKVPTALLMAICTHESGLVNTMVLRDGGSPSYGVCQLKLATAEFLGFKGTGKDLMTPSINAKWAARYLRYQAIKPGGYGFNDWCKLTSAYNMGTYKESRRHPGRPLNIKYIRLVQKKLPNELKHKLYCEKKKVVE